MDQLLEPIKIDYNFIEVSDGFGFDVKGKKFIRNPQWLKGSPRAYVGNAYHEHKIPNAKSFIEGMDKLSMLFWTKKKKLMYSFKCSTYS